MHADTAPEPLFFSHLLVVNANIVRRSRFLWGWGGGGGLATGTPFAFVCYSFFHTVS